MVPLGGWRGRTVRRCRQQRNLVETDKVGKRGGKERAVLAGIGGNVEEAGDGGGARASAIGRYLRSRKVEEISMERYPKISPCRRLLTNMIPAKKAASTFANNQIIVGKKSCSTCRIADRFLLFLLYKQRLPIDFK